MKVARWHGGRVAETRRRISILCHPATLPLCLLFIVACGGRGKAAAASKPTMRDSAGVTIVENGKPAWTEADTWTVADSPSVDIGKAQGDTNYQLFQVSGCLRLSDGRIVVGSYGSHDLRFYDARGRYLDRRGQDGAGPGEFRALTNVLPYRGDSILTWDGRLRRLGVYASDGAFGRNTVPDHPGMNPDLAAAFSDGATLIQDSRFGGFKKAPTQQFAEYVLHRPDGTLADSLGPFPTMKMVRTTFSDGSTMIGAVGFGASTVMAADDSGIVVGFARARAWRLYDRHGTLRRIVRWPGGLRKVTDRDIAAFKHAVMQSVSDANMRRRQAEYFDRIPYADVLPPYDRVMIDRLGDVWFHEFSVPNESRQNTWWVFTPAGRWLGAIELPPALRPYDVGGDYVLGVARDENGVQHVMEYTLRKPRQ